MPYLRTSFSSATRKCISPWPHSTISPMSWLWVSEIEGSSSMILAMAAVSFTSSFFSLAAMAMPNTGGCDARPSRSRSCCPCPRSSVSPVLVLSRRPKRHGVAGMRLAALDRLLAHAA